MVAGIFQPINRVLKYASDSLPNLINRLTANVDMALITRLDHADNVHNRFGGAKNMKKIETTNIQPPIPCRDFDWVATFEGYEPDDCYGHGSSQQAAIDDLKDQSDYENNTERWFTPRTKLGLCSQ